MVTRYILFFVMLVSIFSCKKDENTSTSYQEGIEASRSFVAGQHMMTLLLDTYFKCINDSILITDGENIIDGASVILEGKTPQKITIKYPITWSDKDGYGHLRSGIYEASTETYFNDPDGLVDFTFTSFRYDFDSLNIGEMYIQNLGKPDGTNNQYHLQITNGTVIYADTSGLATFEMTQNFKQLKDPSTIYYTSEDKYEIRGEYRGVTVNEYKFQTVIDSVDYIRNDFSCNWLKFGPTIVNTDWFRFESTVCFPGADSCMYDFVSDTCENQFLIVIDKNPFPYPIDE